MHCLGDIKMGFQSRIVGLLQQLFFRESWYDTHVLDLNFCS